MTVAKTPTPECLAPRGREPSHAIPPPVLCLRPRVPAPGGSLSLGCYDNSVSALGAATGKQQWRFAAGEDVSATPVVADGVVYVGSDDANLYTLDVIAGEERWRFATGGHIISAPGIAKSGTVYVECDDGFVYALGSAGSGGTAALQPVKPTPAAPHHSPAGD